MKYSWCQLWAGLLGVLTLGLAANPCLGQGTLFYLNSGSVGNINSSNCVVFSLTFNCAPDFFTTDQYGRQANSFQFYVADGTNMFTPPYPDRPYSSLIRGSEIFVNGDLRIRNDSPEDPDPNGSGWGSLRGSVPFSLSGDTMTFVIPSSVLNVSGPFTYTLLLTQYGAGIDPYYGFSGGMIDVPEPSTGSLVTLGGLALAFFGQRVRRRQ